MVDILNVQSIFGCGYHVLLWTFHTFVAIPSFGNAVETSYVLVKRIYSRCMSKQTIKNNTLEKNKLKFVPSV